MKLMKYHS